MSTKPVSVAVVGGGISGLAAAWRLSQAGWQVAVYEAASRFGGKLCTSEFAGKQVDTGADAFLARASEGTDLCTELGIETELVSPAQTSSMVWSYGGLHSFPKSTVLGVPSNLDDIQQSGIASTEGIERARQEAQTPPSVIHTDISVGELVESRFGTEIKERLVDPLVGGINAGNVDHLSAATAAPQIFDLIKHDISMTEAARVTLAARQTSTGPMFYAPAGGMQRITDSLVDQLNRRGVAMHANTPVNALEQIDDAWRVTTDRDVVTVNAVVLATPAYQSAYLLESVSPEASSQLRDINYSSVALVRFAYETSAIGIPLDASGFVIPAAEHKLLTACSWASSKWKTLASNNTTILRASAGRYDDNRAETMDDDELVSVAQNELAMMMNISAPPLESNVTRWPDAFPQYEPGHAERAKAIDSSLRKLKTLVVAGAAYNGLGVPACIRSGFGAARALSIALGQQLRG